MELFKYGTPSRGDYYYKNSTEILYKKACFAAPQLFSRADLLGLLQEWPFVQFEQNLFCSHCVITGVDEPYLYAAEVLDLTCPKGFYRTTCPKSKTDMVPTCFVYPLDPGKFFRPNKKILGFPRSCQIKSG